MSSLRFPRGLYGITPNWADTAQLLDAITQAHAGGMVALQWRRKNGDSQDLIDQAKQIKLLCNKLGLIFIVNDSLEIATELDADGVHLGKDDGPIAIARKKLGNTRILGCSCYNQIELASQALDTDVDYIAFGSVFPSTTKPDAPQAGLDLITRAQALTTSYKPKPTVVAIGGITTDNAASLVSSGADSIAVISSLFEAQDITLTAKTFSDLFTQ